MNKIVMIAGGTGFIGSQLTKKLHSADYDVKIITRKAKNTDDKTKLNYISWDSLKSDDLENIYGIINLAGASIAGSKWTESYKQLILDSRIKATRELVDLVSKAKSPPEVFINASAVGYYGDRGTELLTEESSSGKGFLAKVCVEWEKEAITASNHTRTVISRIGVVLDKNEGALSKMLLPFKTFTGGPLGSGKQYFPWIHIKDIVGLFMFALENKSVDGAVNFSSPNPVTMDEFAKTLGKVMNRPSIFKVPEAALKLILGDASEMITNSQRVIPKQASSNGYSFMFSDLKLAFKDIISK
jgi:uncharacterized protein (TIGR01777 family)